MSKKKETKKEQPEIKEAEKTESTELSNGITHLQVVRSFMKLLSKNDFEAALKLTQITWRENFTLDKINELKRFKSECIIGDQFGVREKKKISEVCWIIELRTTKGIFSVKIIREIEPYKTSETGFWGINPLSLRRIK